MENFEFKTLQEIAQTAIDKMNDGIGVGEYGADLLHELFNQDYFIIGYYKAEQWLIANGGVFHNIGIVQEWEQENLGEVSTDLSCSEKVCNMVAYIAGGEVLTYSDTLSEKIDEELTASDIEQIVNELKEEFNL
jgi:hypothetical protein